MLSIDRVIEHRYILNEMDVIARSIPDGLHSVVAMLVNFCESLRNNEATTAGLHDSVAQEKVRSLDMSMYKGTVLREPANN